MDNTVLNEEETHKQLGLIFSQDCSWRACIKGMVKKASQGMNIL